MDRKPTKIEIAFLVALFFAMVAACSYLFAVLSLLKSIGNIGM